MNEIKNIGQVIEIRDGIAICNGLSEIGYGGEVVIQTSNGDVKGQALNLEEDRVGVIVLGNYLSVKAGDKVINSGEILSINASDLLIGKTINALGINLETGEEVVKKGIRMPLEAKAPGIIERKPVTRPLQTGIISIDATIPVGKGQRELVIGDRQTGKTAVCIDTILNQKGKDTICIYVAIGQKAAKISQIKAQLDKEGAMDYTIIVAANASDPTAMQYISPYSGVAIAEYFANNGQDVLIIYDDLTKHAFAYRAISLLLERPPGREAYPGDIFYLHSRLLERAVQLSDEKGGGSITALPVVETQAGDVAAYIPTNIISITDGQIFLDTELFNSGQRPAVNIGTSVSRVGSSAQLKATKQVASKLKLELAQFRELQAFAQFGSELDEVTQKKINTGKMMMELVKQAQAAPYQTYHMVSILYAAVNGYLDEVNLDELARWKEEFISYLDNKDSDGVISQAVESGKKIQDKPEEILKSILEGFTLV